MKKARIEWIDIAKYICIMCVMGSHLESITKPLSIVFSPFFLTLFFFCSGYVYTQKDNFSTFFFKKIKQLFIPWLILSTINILLSQIISFNEHGNLISELIWNFLQIRGKGDGLWFIFALFITFIPFYFVIHWFHKKNLTFQKTLILICFSIFLYILSKLYSIFMNPALLPWESVNLPWHIEYIFIAMFYMILGYLFKIFFETKFDIYNKKPFRLYIWILYLCIVFFYNHYPINNLFITEVLSFIQSLLGIFAVISLCKIIKSNKYILYIGENTLLCFALHGKLYSLLQTILKKCMGEFYYIILDNIFTSSLFAIILTFVMSVILIIPIFVINRYVPFIAGKPLSQKSKQNN